MASMKDIKANELPMDYDTLIKLFRMCQERIEELSSKETRYTNRTWIWNLLPADLIILRKKLLVNLDVFFKGKYKINKKGEIERTN